MNSILSEYNRFSNTPTITKTIRYSDLDFSLRALSHNNVPGDISTLTDIDAIKNSIRNLVLTAPYERPFQPELSSRLQFLLFENADAITALSLKEEIVRVISANEPRASDVYVDVIDNREQNAYEVSVNFSIKNNPAVQTLEFIINRIR